MTFGLGGIAEAFGDRNFRWYSLGSILSWLSFFIQAVAVSWTAWDLTHSTAWLAIVALADASANIVLMPIGGVLADRGDRLRLLLISYACATIQAAILAGLASFGALTIHALTARAAVHGAAHAFSIPASYGLLPRFLLTRLAGATGVAVIGGAAADWGLRGPLLWVAALALMAWIAAYSMRARTAAAFGLHRVRAVEGGRGQ